MGIGIETPQFNLSTNGNYSRGSGLKYIMHLSHTNALDAGDGTSILLTNRGSNTNDYGGYLALVSTGSNPGYLNPRLDFGVQNHNTYQLTDITAKMSILGNGNVGIGTTTPGEKLQVNGNIKVDYNATSITINGYSGIQTSGNSHWLHINRYSNDDVAIGYNSTSNLYLVNGGGNVGIGTTTPDAKLAVKGNIHAEEVKVDLSVPGPDYVFEENYHLKSLAALMQYIQQHKHLPNIPSAKDMEANGIDLGIMNMKLLEKIEELTLYTIQQERETDVLKEKLENQEVELQNQKTLNSSLQETLKEQETRLQKVETLLNALKQ